MRRFTVGSHAAEATAVAEQLAQILTKPGWHDFEVLFEALAKAFCAGGNPEPCRVILRLHAYGRLQNWLRHGSIEQDGGRYRAIGEELFDVRNHAAAEHCRELMETVRATEGGAIDPAWA
jgi:hypothetical protein